MYKLKITSLFAVVEWSGSARCTNGKKSTVFVWEHAAKEEHESLRRIFQMEKHNLPVDC